MKTNHQFKLVEGKFTPSEATSVLFDLLESKINYHNKETLGIRLRFNGDTSHHDKRVNELRGVYEELKQLIATANENGKQLKVDGLVKITLV